MKLNLFLLVVGITFPLVSACTPNQINSAIEACKGDPSCYEIIDEAIEEELTARGITGGKMTNFELLEVASFLNEFSFGSKEGQLNTYIVNYIFWATYILDNGGYEKWNSFARSLDFLNNLNTSFKNHRFFDLESTGLLDKQLIYFEESPGLLYKILIYKSGLDVFKYELYLDQPLVFTIDLKLKSIFYSDQRYSSPLNYYNSMKDNTPLSTLINDELIIQNSEKNEKIRIIENEFGFYVLMNSKYLNSNVIETNYCFYFPINQNYHFGISNVHGEWNEKTVIQNSASKWFVEATHLINHSNVLYEHEVNSDYERQNLTIQIFLDYLFVNEEIMSELETTFYQTNFDEFKNEIYEVFNPIINQKLN